MFATQIKTTMIRSTFKFLVCVLTLMLSAQFAKAQCVIRDTITPTICAGDTFYFNGIPRTRSTVTRPVSDTVTLSSGCDSITVLRLTVRRRAVDSVVQSICSGSSYTFNGQVYTATGIYRDTLLGGSVFGCDSFLILNLTVGGYVSHNITASICPRDSFLFNGTYLKAAGTYRDTIVLTGSCDSIVILRLTLKANPTTTINQQYCTGSSYTFNGVLITAPGVYRDTLFNGAANGCDSIMRLNFLPTYVRVTRRDTLCPTDTLFIPGGGYILGSNGSGRYAPDTVSFGCVDSIFTYNIRIDTPATPMISATGLALTETVTGFSSYQWQLGGSNISGATSGSYTATGNGSYTVAAADARGCVAISAPYNITGVGILGIAGDPKLRLYPNPNSGSFVLETSDADGQEIVISNMLGSVVAHSTVTGNATNIDLGLSEGVYMLKVKNNKGAETTVKFTVAR